MSDRADEKRLSAVEAITTIGAPRSRPLIAPLAAYLSAKVSDMVQYWLARLKERE